MPEISGFEVLRRLKARSMPGAFRSSSFELSTSSTVSYTHRERARGYLTQTVRSDLAAGAHRRVAGKKSLHDREKKFITDLEQKRRARRLAAQRLPLSIVNGMRDGGMVVADSVAEATHLF